MLHGTSSSKDSSSVRHSGRWTFMRALNVFFAVAGGAWLALRGPLVFDWLGVYLWQTVIVSVVFAIFDTQINAFFRKAFGALIVVLLMRR